MYRAILGYKWKHFGVLTYSKHYKLGRMLCYVSAVSIVFLFLNHFLFIYSIYRVGDAFYGATDCC